MIETKYEMRHETCELLVVIEMTYTYINQFLPYLLKFNYSFFIQAAAPQRKRPVFRLSDSASST